MTLVELRFIWTAVVLVLHVNPSQADEKKVCLDKFSLGKDDFVLQTNESVNKGATFLGSPLVSRPEDCVQACCRNPECNLALIEDGQDSQTIKTCFIFNCLYKQKRVCHFVKKMGFRNYLSTSVFKDYLEQKLSVPGEEDKPPVAKAGQDRVVQPHDDVILNGIESSDDKKIVKFEWTMVSGNPSAVLSKSPHFEDSVTVSNLSPGKYVFGLTVTDEAGHTDSAEVSVLVLTPEESLHHCMVPKKEGPCRGSFVRWHYNAASEKCEEFKYGGCKPNQNNYLTLEECQNACDKVLENPQLPSGRLGPIHPDKEQCDVSCGPQHFACSNNCCISRDLECDDDPNCSDHSDETQCSTLDKKFNRLLNIPVDKSKAHCIDPPVTGPCRASMTNWYYNPYERRCNRFNYGGCDGNFNRFESEEMCMSSCSTVTESDVFERKASFEKLQDNNDTVILAIAVLLGIAIAVLLIVLACCLLKGKKKRNKHHQVAVNGGHVHMYEDSEKLVYNSTTKPI